MPSPLRVRFVYGTRHRMKGNARVWVVNWSDAHGVNLVNLASETDAFLSVTTHWARKNLRAVPKRQKGKKP